EHGDRHGILPRQSPFSAVALRGASRASAQAVLILAVGMAILFLGGLAFGEMGGGWGVFSEGRTHAPGWVYPVRVLAVKIPLGVWALFLWSVGAACFQTGRGTRGMDELCLLLPIVGLLTGSFLLRGTDFHVFDALPALPFALISAGRLACCFQAR